MLKKILVILALAILAGCASVPLESPEKDKQAKQFNPPQAGNAGIYIYRNSYSMSGIKKDLWINGDCVGETAPKSFFYSEVAGDKNYKISTESEFSPNSINVDVKSGLLYFIRQYIKPGVFVGGANLEVVDAETGKKAVTKLPMAKNGRCSIMHYGK